MGTWWGFNDLILICTYITYVYIYKYVSFTFGVYPTWLGIDLGIYLSIDTGLLVLLHIGDIMVRVKTGGRFHDLSSLKQPLKKAWPIYIQIPWGIYLLYIFTSIGNPWLLGYSSCIWWLPSPGASDETLGHCWRARRSSAVMDGPVMRRRLRSGRWTPWLNGYNLEVS